MCQKSKLKKKNSQCTLMIRGHDIMPDIWQMVTQDRSSSLKQSNNISSRFNQVRKAPAEPGGKGAAGWTLWWELQPCSAENQAACDEEGRSYILALSSAAPSLLAMADL